LRIVFSLKTGVAGIIGALALVSAGAASAADVVVNATIDLEAPQTLASSTYINTEGGDGFGFLFVPAVDIAIGDTFSYTAMFANNKQITATDIADAGASVWTQNWTNYGSSSMTGTLSFLDSLGAVIYTTGSASSTGCCVHAGVYGEYGGTFDPGTITFSGVRFDGVIDAYFDDVTTRTYDQAHFYIYADNLSITDVQQGVPEPTTWALMILGFGAAGTALRRRHALAA